jgi:hypothetical protein
MVFVIEPVTNSVAAEMSWGRYGALFARLPKGIGDRQARRTPPAFERPPDQLRMGSVIFD